MTDWQEGDLRVLVGDCRERLRELPDASVDAIVTDPPAGISFMGAAWDTFPTRQRPAEHVFTDGRARPGIAAGQEHNPRAKGVFIAWLAGIMSEALRVAKPGALGLVWAIPRTAHWTANALEEAGWEIHPNGFIAHHFASGFPKAKTHLKPATEIWWLVRKPGPGGLNIDTCRIGLGAGGDREGEASAERRYSDQAGDFAMLPGPRGGDARGRWPANLVLSHAEGCVPVGTRRVRGAGWRDDDQSLRRASTAYNAAGDGSLRAAGTVHYAAADGTEAVEAWECVESCPVAELDRQSGRLRSGAWNGVVNARRENTAKGSERERIRDDRASDVGGASRFFYVAKASASERSLGLPPGQRNTHPTVKPIELMCWLVRLVTPSGGVVLDPFAGSGTTLIAAQLEGFGAIGIEQDEESVRTAVARLNHWRHQPALELADEPAPVVPAAGPVCVRCGSPGPGLREYLSGFYCAAGCVAVPAEAR